MNPLNEYPGARKVAYIVSFVVGLALGAVQVGFASADQGQPVWLTVALSVYAFIGAGLGLTAAQNTPSYRDVVEGDAPAPPVERGAVTAQTIVLAIVLLLVVLIFFGVSVNVR